MQRTARKGTLISASFVKSRSPCGPGGEGKEGVGVSGVRSETPALLTRGHLAVRCVVRKSEQM